MAASLRRLRKLPELVLTDPLTLWMAPKSRPRLSADQYRDRLGLPHLPRLGSADYGARLLLRVSFDSAEFAASGILARRPCHLDFPGIRFRAFCRNESDKSRAKKPRKVGKTASLESGFPDGFDELIFQLPPDAPIKKWKVKNLGELTGRHANADRHGEFADHLRKRNSKNKNLCKYHFGPLSQQVLSNELERLLM